MNHTLCHSKLRMHSVCSKTLAPASPLSHLPSRSAIARPRGSIGAPIAAVSMDTAVAKKQTYVSKEARQALFGRGKEQTVEVEAEVQGSIPTWLSGSMLINGGGDYQGMQHLFDGYAMISKLRIEGGKVFGSQKFVNSEAYNHWTTTGKMKWREFGTEVKTANIFEEAAIVMDTIGMNPRLEPSATDNPSVNVVALADGSVLAMSETKGAQYRIDPKTLKTLGQVAYTDGLPGVLNTAHPKRLPDGNLVNFTRSLPFGGFHVYKQDTKTLARTQLAYIPDRKSDAPSWVHDMCITANHLVICETPGFLNMGKFTFGGSTDHVVVDWLPELGTRVHVVPLNGGAVKSYDAPPFFTFHYANGFEDANGDIHIDMAVYDGAQILNDLLFKNLLAYPGVEVSQSALRRLTIPKIGYRCDAPHALIKDEASHGNFAEFTCFNPAFSGKENQFVWSQVATRPTNMGNSIGKFDLRDGSCKVWHQDGSLPGEAAFIASPGAKDEDDGVLLAPLMGADGRSSMLVLDAKTMQEIGRATLPFAIPYRFHGTFIPN